ncbi:MAG: peptidase M23 [Oligoflexia bacterium]|nr:MAG: peptidase M23 [Oligoflexia bacterium]
MRLLLCFALLLLNQKSLAAKDKPELIRLKSVERLAEDYEKTKKNLIQDEVKQRQILSSLFEINKKMKKIVTEQGDLVQERLLVESTTKELAARILELEEKLKSQKSLMRERLSAIYKLGGQGVARMLFASTNSAQLERNLKILGIIAKRDLEIIKGYSIIVNELGSKRIKFTQRLAHLKKLESNIKKTEALLISENALKNKFLDKIRKSKQFALIKLNGLREKSAQLNTNDDSGVLDLLFRPSFFEQKGHLEAPVVGRITQGFGIIRDQEHNVSWSHKGIFISTDFSTNVHSVFDGKIAFIGHIPGHGQTVIVDHGDHYYTVYGHTENVSVKLGDEIKKNQIIAKSGATSEEHGSGIYFEVRHFSEPADPKQWIKGTAL